MALTDLDHINIRTSRLAEMSRFYDEVLGLPTGWRPGFGFGGAWHYCGDKPVVHLVEVAQQPSVGEPQLEHFAFRAEGLSGFTAKLDGHGLPYEQRDVPDNGHTQVFLRDPDGNHIEIQFAAGES